MAENTVVVLCFPNNLNSKYFVWSDLANWPSGMEFAERFEISDLLSIELHHGRYSAIRFDSLNSPAITFSDS
jgi:hypothetical protein